MLNIVIFGAPGSGKGTQAQLMAEKYNLMHLSTGDILRSSIERQTPKGIEAKKYIDKGELVPDEVVNAIVARRINENHDKFNGFVFDGFPRTTAQAEELDKMLSEKDATLNLMLAMEVKHEELMSRLNNRAKTGNRTDDQNLSIIENRITIYHEITKPVIDFYKAQNKFNAINGMGTIEEIFERIDLAVKPHNL